MDQPAYVVEAITKCEETRILVEVDSARARDKEAQRLIKKQERQTKQQLGAKR